MDPFGLHLLAHGYAQTTAASYVGRVAAAQRYFQGRLLTATPEDMLGFFQNLPNTHASRRLAVCALAAWYGWQGSVLPARPRVPRKPQYICRALEPEQAKRLAQTAVGAGLPGLAVLFGLFLALRASEIGAARWDQFTHDFAWFTAYGKGGTQADLPVPSRFAELVKERQTAWRFIFPGSRGRAHITYATVYEWVQAVGVRAGIPNLEPHRLRHTSLATANDNTGDLRAVQAFARHTRPDVTALYTRATAAKLRVVAESLDFLD